MTLLIRGANGGIRVSSQHSTPLTAMTAWRMVRKGLRSTINTISLSIRPNSVGRLRAREGEGKGNTDDWIRFDQQNRKCWACAADMSDRHARQSKFDRCPGWQQSDFIIVCKSAKMKRSHRNSFHCRLMWCTGLTVYFFYRHRTEHAICSLRNRLQSEFCQIYFHTRDV